MRNQFLKNYGIFDLYASHICFFLKQMEIKLFSNKYIRKLLTVPAKSSTLKGNSRCNWHIVEPFS